MNPRDVSDRRRFPRSAAVPGTAIVLARKTMRVCCSLENLSAGGAQLVGELQLSPGEHVRVQLQLNLDHGLAFDAEVVRCVAEPGDRFRTAVVFRNVPTQIQDRVQRLVLTALERQRASAEPVVLVLDDDPEIRAVLDRDLRVLGRHVVLAATPLDVVRLLQDPARRFDVALVDSWLGASDGIDVLAYLRDEYPDIRRVLISGSVAVEVRDRVIRSKHAHAFLAKPWTRASLVDALAVGPDDRAPRRLAGHTREL